MGKPFHSLSTEECLSGLASSLKGLSQNEVSARQQLYGPNVLPEAAHASVIKIFFKQFLNPLIYVLLFAAVLSYGIGESTDGAFILIVLLINAVIGAVQEISAERSAASLDVMVSRTAHVLRDGDAYEIDASELVPGDIVRLESGDMVPADCRLVNVQSLEVDESLLSGESLPVEKDRLDVLAEDTVVADRLNMVFAGTLVVHGRATAIVITTALETELGKIARDVLSSEKAKPPLVVRMERFTWRLTWIMMVMTVVIAVVVLLQGMPWFDVLFLAVALAVAAIPEGLPVAITIAMAVSIRRMAKRNVIAKNLVAVEALGSCTFIASDKTGTLTRNEISVEALALPGEATMMLPASNILNENEQPAFREAIDQQQLARVLELSHVAAMANEAFLGHRDGSFVSHGDSMDVALLVLAHNLGCYRDEAPVMMENWQPVATIPFESASRFGASLHEKNGRYKVYVKGAIETIVEMCSLSLDQSGCVEIDKQQLLDQAKQLAAQGYRVLAMASGEIEPRDKKKLSEDELKGLVFNGLAGMIDPLRSESKTSIQHCFDAGIEVSMLTGDHPTTAYAIAKQLTLADSMQQVAGPRDALFTMQDVQQRALAIKEKRVFARLEPHQKLDVVNSLQAAGEFVAMTGDGANDAPALRSAHVGVAMGKAGTAVARETADIILADDNFSSIVAGVEEGRIAYSNVRKVVHLLLSTGFAEIVLFFLSLLAGLPIPLTAVQLLWLNLVTNGVQHVALAFEPGEGDELEKSPRSPQEAIFNRVMIERVVLAAMLMGVVAFISFYYLLLMGFELEAARNGTLLLMVMFENMHVFNSRSETRSFFSQRIFRNPALVLSVIAAQLIHIGAMHLPGLSAVLDMQIVSFSEWLKYFALALSLLLMGELYKVVRKQL